MKCPTCAHDNLESCHFCVRCHAPLRFICPACEHVQGYGSKCDAFGVDISNYASMLAFTNKTVLQHGRAPKAGRDEILGQILLLPITGGHSSSFSGVQQAKNRASRRHNVAALVCV
ncbi:MAG: hypothetical protein M1404_00825 [Acidobacteria bacterium]|nr:hypothetical protein [Acidobacteriota bacterium]